VELAPLHQEPLEAVQEQDERHDEARRADQGGEVVHPSPLPPLLLL
jgi:hypothetical protein